MGGGTKVAVDEDIQVTDSVDWFNGRASRRTPHHLSLVGIELRVVYEWQLYYKCVC